MKVDRRKFSKGLLAVTAGFAALPSTNAHAEAPLPPKSPCGVASTAMGAHLRGLEGIAKPLRNDPVAYLEYCRSLGAGGVQHAVSTDLSRFKQRLDELGMYYEGEAVLPSSLDEDTAGFDRSIADAASLGASCVRSVSRPPRGSSGRRYESFASYGEFKDWLELSNAIVMKCLPIAEKHKVAIALENHKDRQVDEHATFLRRASSEYLGALIDPGNNMSFMEHPEQFVALLAPYAKACSLKDMGVAPYADGFLLSEVPFDTGCTNQRKLFATLRRHNSRINPVTELITRDPLQVPVLTERYYRSFPAAHRGRRDAWLAWVKAHQTDLPAVGGLTPAQRLQLEADNNRQAFAWGATHLRDV